MYVYTATAEDVIQHERKENCVTSDSVKLCPYINNYIVPGERSSNALMPMILVLVGARICQTVCYVTV